MTPSGRLVAEMPRAWPTPMLQDANGGPRNHPAKLAAPSAVRRRAFAKVSVHPADLHLDSGHHGGCGRAPCDQRRVQDRHRGGHRHYGETECKPREAGARDHAPRGNVRDAAPQRRERREGEQIRRAQCSRMERDRLRRDGPHRLPDQGGSEGHDHSVAQRHDEEGQEGGGSVHASFKFDQASASSTTSPWSGARHVHPRFSWMRFLIASAAAGSPWVTNVSTGRGDTLESHARISR